MGETDSQEKKTGVNKTVAEKNKSADKRRQEEQNKLFKNQIVVQRNELLRGDTSIFENDELKVYKLIISKINPKATAFEEKYQITSQELECLGINKKHLYDKATKILQKIASVYVSIMENNTPKLVGLIRNEFSFPRYASVIEYSMNENIKQYLLSLDNGGFTQYPFLDIVNFKYKYTLKLYEYIKSTNLTVIQMKVETLREKLETVDVYPNFSELKRKVIEVAIDEINEKSETLHIECTYKKQGRNVTHVIFHITRINILENPQKKNKYSNFVGKVCQYQNKYYVVNEININELTIVLKEQILNDLESLVYSKKEELDKQLDLWFPIDTQTSKNGSPTSYLEEETKTPLLMDDIKKIAEFKKFKAKTIETFKGQYLLNNAPNFLENTIIAIDEDGHLINTIVERKITKEEAFVIWNYLFENQEKVGVIEIVEYPIKPFINTYIKIMEHHALLKKNVETIYKVTDIILQESKKYKIKIEERNGNDIKLTPQEFTYQEVKTFIETYQVDIFQEK